MRNTILNWSGGKDATMALHQLREEKDVKIVSLLTTINAERRRITMHGVHEDLLQAQIKSIGESVELMELPENISMDKYSKITQGVAKNHFKEGVTHYAYGDINLTDLRQFRDTELAKNNITPIYPLWEKPTADLAQEFIKLGYKAIIVATSSNKLDDSFVGKLYDENFLNSLPKDVDPCGENGEFHTFVFDGPIFKTPINVTVGDKTYQTYTPSKNDDDCFCDKEDQQDWDKGFWFCELSLN
jgi:uncharacterized protein (TIGR00290 family)